MTLSLIQAIILLEQGEFLQGHKQLECLEASPENLVMAKELAHRVLGKGLSYLPKETKLLFLMIERMVERECGGKISGFRFTRWCLKKETGWADRVLRVHLDRLETMRYLAGHREERVCRYELVYRRRIVACVKRDRI